MDRLFVSFPLSSVHHFAWVWDHLYCILFYVRIFIILFRVLEFTQHTKYPEKKVEGPTSLSLYSFITTKNNDDEDFSLHLSWFFKLL